MPPKKTTSADQIKKDADKYDKQKKQERDERRVEKKLMRDEELTDEEKSIALRNQEVRTIRLTLIIFTKKMNLWRQMVKIRCFSFFLPFFFPS